MVFLNPIRHSSLGARLSRYEFARVWAKRPSLLFGLCAVTLVASLMLGGGTRGGLFVGHYFGTDRDPGISGGAVVAHRIAVERQPSVAPSGH